MFTSMAQGVRYLSLFIIIASIAACDGGGGGNDGGNQNQNQVNYPPIAGFTADNDTIEVGQTITLDGSSSADQDDEFLEYSWTLSQKPQGSVVGTNLGTMI
ncbi:MAG: PKD domain-containing protein [Gammaproteobacteria bacterium]|nr:PKD domain-containing protein [Gammaproteobacteria bacterium]MDH5800434.1 PKD domain-containing protein [Gammaproteobacteria bacterium]